MRGEFSGQAGGELNASGTHLVLRQPTSTEWLYWIAAPLGQSPSSSQGYKHLPVNVYHQY
eukprot:2271843-Rhodomonas_salina.4